MELEEIIFIITFKALDSTYKPLRVLSEMHLIKLLKLSAGWLTASKLAPGNITFVLLKIIEFVIKFIKYAQGEHHGENCLHTELYDIIN